MSYNCQNCNRPIPEKFCGNCGQKHYKRIDRKYIWDEVQYTLLHTNKGFLYSVKKILKNPGLTAREFIEGNRINHYKPILLAFVLSSISAFISYKLIGLNEIMKAFYADQKQLSEIMNRTVSFMASYNSFIILCALPIFAVFTSISFRNWGQNFYEHVVMNAYILSFYTLITIILFYPLLYFWRGDMVVVQRLLMISSSSIVLMVIWFYRGFYHDKPLKYVILRTLLVFLIIFICYILLIFAAIILIVVINGPEALKAMQPK